jgi:hypothetical protein
MGRGIGVFEANLALLQISAVHFFYKRCPLQPRLCLLSPVHLAWFR